MPKDFDQWNTLKKQIDENKELSGFSEREVWWCRLGHNIGFEEDGKNLAFSRPILKLRKFNKHFFLRGSVKYPRKDGQSLLLSL